MSFDTAKIASLTLLLLLCVSLGCDQQTRVTDQKGGLKDVSIGEFGSLRVAVKQCKQVDKGMATTDGIVVVANEGSQIGSISLTVFYDHDGSNVLSKSDGVISSIRSQTVNPTAEALINPGLVHCSPGIGPLMVECIAEVIQGDQTELVHFCADLSPIFENDET